MPHAIDSAPEGKHEERDHPTPLDRPLLDAISDIVFVHDLDTGAIVDVNERACEAYGYTREEFRELDVGTLSAGEPPYSDAEAAALIAAAAAGRPQRAEWLARRRDGSLFWEEVALRRGRLGGVERMLVTAHDIDARKQAELALAGSEARYRALYEQVPVSLWVEDWTEVIAAVRGLTDAGVSDFPAHFAAHPEVVDDCLQKVKILDVNPATLTMFGAASKDEMLASLETVFATPDTLPGFVGELVALGRGEPVYCTEMALNKVDGNTFQVLLTMTFPAPEDDSGRVLVSLVDLSDRIAAEEARRKAHARAAVAAERERHIHKLQAAIADLEAFSYSVSHDLRAPLRAIDSYAQILMEEFAAGLEPEAQRMLQVVRGNAQKLGRLIEDLLEFSRAGRQELARQEVDISALCRGLFAELAEPGRAVDFELPPLPPALADPAAMRQVFSNLLANALKFSARRERARIAVGGERRGGELRYWVRDNGVGFQPEYAGKLFRVFSRLHGVEEFPGTGMGLAIVKRIVRKHGGQVWAESQPGESACFGFTLPVPAGSPEEMK